MKRIIGLDYGDKNIGVAVSCPYLIVATGVCTIRRDSAESFKKPILEIRQIMREYDSSTIVLGYPQNMDGSSGERCQKTMEFKERLSRNFKSAEIILWDERCSSLTSERDMLNMNVSKSRIKEIIDEASAVYILQGYLDFYNKGKQN